MANFIIVKDDNMIQVSNQVLVEIMTSDSKVRFEKVREDGEDKIFRFPYLDSLNSVDESSKDDLSKETLEMKIREEMKIRDFLDKNVFSIMFECYKRNCGDRCPHCGSDELNGNHFECEGKHGWRDVECYDCGAEFTEEFDLTRIIFLPNPTKKEK